MYRALTTLSLFLVMTATGCMSVQTSDEDITVIDVEDVVELMADKKAKTLLVDVRIPSKFRENHIPGAVNIPVREIYPGDDRLDQAKTIITYGDNWHDPLSRAAAKTLIRSGYNATIFEFKGGIELWQDAGKGVVGSGADTGGRPESGK